jgi:predicted transcriptional regulator
MFPSLENIGKRRKALGITQQQMAARIGISQSLVAKIERNLVVPNYKIACDIFDFLDKAERSGERRAEQIMHRNVIALKPRDTVETAANLAKKRLISQFPVVSGSSMVGSVTTARLVGLRNRTAIADIMGEPFPTISPDAPVSVISALLRRYSAALVLRKGKIAGIITAEDLL